MRLQAKIILLIVAVTLVTGLGASFLVSQMMRGALESELQDQAIVAAASLSEHVAHSVIDGEVVEVHEAVRKMMQRTPDIQYIYIVGFDGRLFAHTFEGGFPKALAAIAFQHDPETAEIPRMMRLINSRRIGLTASPSPCPLPPGEGWGEGGTARPDNFETVNKTETRRVLDIYSPLINGMRAEIHVGMDEEHTLDRVASLRNRILVFSLIIAVACIAIGAIVSRRLTRPLSDLAGAMRDFGERKVGEGLLPGGGGREIDDLTRAFNRMISERQNAERHLRESEDKFRSFFENATDGILILDLEQERFADGNSTICRMLGYTIDEIRTLRVRDIHPERNLPAVMGILERQIRGEITLAPDIPILRKDGSVLYADIIATRVVLAGRPCIAGVFRDITERKKDEEKIRQSQEFIRSILDTVDEGFLVIDRDYRIQIVNRAYCDQVGLPCDEVIGKHCYEISHNISRPCYEEGEECAVRIVFRNGYPHGALHKHKDRDGHILFVETKAFPIKDASGNVISAIETMNNITEKHLLEEERLKTQKLESIGTLAGGIAHDFNNLLQGIFGYISMAKLTFNQRDKSLDMLEQAEKALHQSVNLTTQLLTFSRGGKPVKRRLSLPPVIENAVKFALSGSRSGYRMQSDPGLWQVDADEGQLGQVIQNIVLNADQAMPLGGSVVIRARNLSAFDESRPPVLGKRDHVMISIQDSGVGISEQDRGRIFDPYFTTKEKGSGLGLATSYSIIRNHDGMIDVKSEVGKGSTFFLYLPAAEAVAEEPRQEAVPAGTRTGRILIMDDEKIIRKVVGELLGALGHTAAFVDKGETALEAYRKAQESGRPFDVVILDLTIRGGMGGEETIRKLLEIDPNVKAVVSSGYSDDATLAHYRQRGFRAFLKKPYTIAELQSTLDALLA